MRTFSILFFSSGLVAFAALPPQVQYDKDRVVMERFVQEHNVVSSTLRHIDVANKTVFFGKGCVAKFVRKTTFHLPGWVGPASDLVFKSSNCKID